jgi:hypothetical protein
MTKIQGVIELQNIENDRRMMQTTIRIMTILRRNLIVVLVGITNATKQKNGGDIKMMTTTINTVTLLLPHSVRTIRTTIGAGVSDIETKRSTQRKRKIVQKTIKKEKKQERQSARTFKGYSHKYYSDLWTIRHFKSIGHGKDSTQL